MVDNICKTINQVGGDLQYVMQGKLDIRPKVVCIAVDQKITCAQPVILLRKVAVHPSEPARRWRPVFKVTVADRCAVHIFQEEPESSLRLIQDGPIVPGRAKLGLRKEVLVKA